jgi:hypothetical protein
MSSISAERVPVQSITPFQVSDAIKPSAEEREELERQFKSVLEGAYTRPMGNTDSGDYAQVVVNGKVVATLSNSGSAAMSNALGGQLGGSLDNDGTGPALAQRRAEQIAKALGGKVVKSSSAMTSSQWANRAPPQTYVDFAAMAADGNLGMRQRLSGSDSALSAQLLGQEFGEGSAR